MEKYVKNDVVHMLWKADNFFEVDGTLVAAVQDYNGVFVVFMNNDAFLLYDEQDPSELANREGIIAILQEAIKEGYMIQEEYSDLYVPLLGGSGVDTETLKSYGIGAENADDINKRLIDLAPYFEVTYVDDPNDAY